ELLPEIGSSEFSARLIAMIGSLAHVDEATIIFYRNAGPPSIDFAMPSSWRLPNLEIFTKGAFLLDPYYLAASRDRKSGFFRLRDLAPGGFRQSEYYRIYYAGSGLQDECGYLIALEDNSFVNIALGLTKERAFSKDSLAVFSDMAPLVETLCHIHWNSNFGAAKADGDSRVILESVLNSFGSAILTRRECEVVQMLLLGHTAKKVAEQLGISYETVKLHRKHAYAKLGINNQAGLFYAFIDSLLNADPQGDIDAPVEA
ncbi:MAG: helix-turn-helix transcriptional regulator, partial [Halioglobus sp.]|nr:helix-turn-helix transcriptional regulator [Halioglobus sp.]